MPLSYGGWGGLFAVTLMRRYGRLPVLFWSQVRANSLIEWSDVDEELVTVALIGILGWSHLCTESQHIHWCEHPCSITIPERSMRTT